MNNKHSSIRPEFIVTSEDYITPLVEFEQKKKEMRELKQKKKETNIVAAEHRFRKGFKERKQGKKKSIKNIWQGSKRKRERCNICFKIIEGG